MADPTEPRPPIRFSLREVVALMLTIAAVLSLAKSFSAPFQIILPVPLCGIAVLLFVARASVLRGLAIGAGTAIVVIHPAIWASYGPGFGTFILLEAAACSWGALFGGCAWAAIKGYGVAAVIVLLSAFWLTGLLIMATG